MSRSLFGRTEEHQLQCRPSLRKKVLCYISYSQSQNSEMLPNLHAVVTWQLQVKLWQRMKLSNRWGSRMWRGCRSVTLLSPHRGNSHLSTDRRWMDAAREAALTRRFFRACTFHFGDDSSFQNVPNGSFGSRVTRGRRTSRRELSGRPGGLPSDREDAHGLPGLLLLRLPWLAGFQHRPSTPARAAPCAEPTSQPASPGRGRHLRTQWGLEKDTQWHWDHTAGRWLHPLPSRSICTTVLWVGQEANIVIQSRKGTLKERNTPDPVLGKPKP